MTVFLTPLFTFLNQFKAMDVSELKDADYPT